MGTGPVKGKETKMKETELRETEGREAKKSQSKPRFNTRDLAFIGIIGAAVFIVHRVLLVVATATGLPFAAQFVHPTIAALPDAALLALVGGRVKKTGAYTLTAVIWAVLYVIFSVPQSFIYFAIGGPFADLVAWFFRKSGRGDSAANYMASMGAFFAARTTIGFFSLNYLFGIARLLAIPPVLWALYIVVATSLGIAGGWVGYKIVRELSKAGVMR